MDWHASRHTFDSSRLPPSAARIVQETSSFIESIDSDATLSVDVKGKVRVSDTHDRADAEFKVGGMQHRPIRET
jgi:hypothetical protein